MTTDLRTAFQAVDKATRVSTPVPGLKEAEVKLQDDLAALREQHARGYVKDRTSRESDPVLQAKRQEAAVRRLATGAAFAVKTGLGSLGESIDLRGEFDAALPALTAKVNAAVEEYVAARVPVARSVVEAAQRIDQEVANSAVSEVVEAAKPYLDVIRKHSRVKETQAANLEAAKAILTVNENKLLTPEIRHSLGIPEGSTPDEKAAANERAKQILVLKIAEKVKSLASA